jgi:hypothetical protein
VEHGNCHGEGRIERRLRISQYMQCTAYSQVPA